MAINQSRSMNGDLRIGAVEGKYKDLRPNTGGEEINREVNLAERAQLLADNGFGIVSSSSKVLPDGTKQ